METTLIIALVIIFVCAIIAFNDKSGDDKKKGVKKDEF